MTLVQDGVALLVARRFMAAHKMQLELYTDGDLKQWKCMFRNADGVWWNWGDTITGAVYIALWDYFVNGTGMTPQDAVAAIQREFEDARRASTAARDADA